MGALVRDFEDEGAALEAELAEGDVACGTRRRPRGRGRRARRRRGRDGIEGIDGRSVASAESEGDEDDEESALHALQCTSEAGDGDGHRAFGARCAGAELTMVVAAPAEDGAHRRQRAAEACAGR